MAAMQPTQTAGISNADMNAYIGKIGNLLRRNQVSKNGGKDDAFIKQIDEAYRQFTESVKDQEEWMKKATDEQKEVFRGVTENFYKLRRADKDDLESLHKEFKAAVVRLNEIDGDHPAKGELERVAALGMKHTDISKAKPKGLAGALKGELNHRAKNYFKPTKDDLESPLFRWAAGLDKKGPGGLNPLHELQNEGTAEKLIRQAGEKITGEDVKDKANAMASEIAGGVKGSGGSGGFPSKVENLHVENLIVKMVRKADEDGQKSPRYMPPTLPGNATGRSAIAVGSPLLPGPSSGGAHAELVPALPHNPTPMLEDHRAKQQENQLPFRLAGPKHEAEDVEFKESPDPIQVKQRNPHAKLKTGLTPLASAVAGAVDAYPSFKPSEGVVGAIKPDDALVSNDIDPRSADATKQIDDGDDKDSGSGIGGSLAGAALTAATEFLTREKGPKENAKEKGATEEKTKGAVEEEGVKAKGPKEGLLEEGGKGLAGEARAGSKLLKGAAKLGKVAGIAGTAITAYTSYEDYADADAKLKAGKITAQQAKEQKAHAVGGGLGSVIGGYAGGALGGIAGSFVAPGVGTLAGGAAGSMLGARAGEWIGDEIGSWWAKPASDKTKEVHQVAQHSAQTSKPTVVVQQNHAAPAASDKPAIVPVKAEPRSRESYFDRQMMNTVMF
jgi:hypothetical protein